MSARVLSAWLRWRIIRPGLFTGTSKTLSGPKKDRLELLRHTRAHLGQLFMLYDDPACAADRLLDGAAQSPPLVSLTDEYETVHRIWKISDPAQTAAITSLMADKKLLIADGHHRYETALAYRNENPDLPEAGMVMMTFVNMHSPGLAYSRYSPAPEWNRGSRYRRAIAQGARVFPSG